MLAGTFTMNDGNITGNTAQYGGGVAVSGGTFTMNGGIIAGNTARDDGIHHSKELNHHEKHTTGEILKIRDWNALKKYLENM